MPLFRLSKLNDPLTRQMIWHTLWDKVLDGEMKAQDYVEIVLNQGSQEKDTLILSKILRTLSDHSSGAETVLKFLNGEQRVQAQKKIESFIKRHLLAAPAGSDLQLVWYQTFLSLPPSTESLAYSKALLSGKQKLRGFRVEQDHRWELIQKLARSGVPEAPELIANELNHDKTDIGEKASIAASALLPNPQSKATWLARITSWDLSSAPPRSH